jgi:hypothetical protein
MAIVNTTKAPNLVLSERDYKIDNEAQFRNQLRIYFNQVDTLSEQLLIDEGGSNLSFPHIAASHNADQEADGDDTPTKVLWDTLETAKGFTLNADSTATAQYTGVYKIDYGLQLSNTANALHDTKVWLQVNGSDVPRSSVVFTLPARKSIGDPSLLLAYSSTVFSCEAGQSFALYWATDQAYESGVTDGIYLLNEPATTTPYVSPATPSAIGSITFVSRA